MSFHKTVEQKLNRMFDRIEGPPSEDEEYISYYLRRGTLNTLLLGSIIGTALFTLAVWCKLI